MVRKLIWACICLGLIIGSFNIVYSAIIGNMLSVFINSVLMCILLTASAIIRLLTREDK